MTEKHIGICELNMTKDWLQRHSPTSLIRNPNSPSFHNISVDYRMTTADHWVTHAGPPLTQQGLRYLVYSIKETGRQLETKTVNEDIMAQLLTKPIALD